MDYKFTIFTPVYNGANHIERVFESVASQTYSNFEWIIINDGSTDNSCEVIKSLLKKYKDIEDKIIYREQRNSGKHIAWNRALDLSTGQIWLPADCDDSFVPTTLSFFNGKCNEISNFLESNIAGINVCCLNPDTGKMIGTPYQYDGLISNNIELYYKYNVVGEKWGCQRVDLLKRYKFPESCRGHFYPESYIWYSFPKDGYSTVCYNECLRRYYYVETSLINNKNYRYDLNKQKTYLHFITWEIINIGSLIFSYSKKDWVRLIAIFILQVFKVIYCFFYSILKMRINR